MARGVHAYDPDGEFVVRRTLTTSREFAAGETFENSSVTPRRLRQLYDRRSIIPRDQVERNFASFRQGALRPWRKGEDQTGRHSTKQDEAPEPSGEEAPDTESLADQIDALIARRRSNEIGFLAFKAEATKLLGTDFPGQTRQADIIAALEAKRDAAP